MENDFLGELWDNFYKLGAQRALKIKAFKTTLDNMIKQGTSFYKLKDELLESFYFSSKPR